MKVKIFLAAVAVVSLAVSVSLSGNAEAAYTKGYYKKNGTYVKPYYKTSPNSTKYDNYSTKGNTNPYTGSKGYKSPYKSYSSYGSGSSYKSYSSYSSNY